MSAAVPLAGHSAFATAVLSAAKLSGVVWRGPEYLVETHRRETIAALERLAEACGDPPWLRWRIASLLDEETWRADWTEESGTLIERLGELLALDEALDAQPAPVAAPAATASRHASPPPPSGRGDEMALEMGAARDARDTEPPPWSSEWWGDFPTVRC